MAMKESAQLRTGSSKEVVDKSQTEIVKRLRKNEFDQFWEINEQFGNTPLEELKFFPV